MPDASDRAPRAAAKSNEAAVRAAPSPIAVPEFRPFDGVLDLQAKAGNQAVGRMLAAPPPPGEAKGGVMPAAHTPSLRASLIRRAPPTATAPNASMPGPNQSSAGPSAARMNNGIGFRGHVVFPDQARCLALLKELLPEKGFKDAHNFGAEFLAADTAMKAGWSIVADPDYIDRTIAAMRPAVEQFREECRIFMEKFETQASNMVDMMLINAEDQINKEKQKLGLKMDINSTEFGDYKSYTATNKDYLKDAQRAAGELAKKKRIADARKDKVDDAKRREEQARAATPAGLAGAQAGLVPPPSQGTVNVPGLGPATIVSEVAALQAEWKTADLDFRQGAQQATAKYTSIGPYLMGPSADIASRLDGFATEKPEGAEQNLGEQFDEKLKNIQKVRSEFGGRYSIWKQPMVIAMMHQQLNSSTGERRLVTDKVQADTQKAEDAKQLYTAIALGVGLLAAVPTGGASVGLAAVVLAASVTSVALGAYQAYEEAQDYMLKSAAANTSLDRAHQISEDDPSLLYLAIDIAGVIADVAGARAAFVALKEAIAVAKAAKTIEQLPKVMQSMRAAHISGANQGKVLAEVLPSGGDIGKALHDIRQVFIKTAESAADQETAALMKMVAERAMDRGKVIVFPNSRVEAEAVLRFRLEAKGFKGEELTSEVNGLLDDFFTKGNNGIFDPITKLVYIRGDASAEAAAAILVHEMTHSAQDAMGMMKRMGKYASEFEAYKAQQQFLGLLPVEKVPDDYMWLLKATDHDIENHVLTYYVGEGVFKPFGTNNAAIADGMFNTLFSGGGR
ncbi:MAG: hypothetical protein ACKVVT_13645 [Dehalococcoidia bacterium]